MYSTIECTHTIISDINPLSLIWGRLCDFVFASRFFERCFDLLLLIFWWEFSIIWHYFFSLHTRTSHVHKNTDEIALTGNGKFLQHGATNTNCIWCCYGLRDECELANSALHNRNHTTCWFPWRRILSVFHNAHEFRQYDEGFVLLCIMIMKCDCDFHFKIRWRGCH